MKILAQTFIVLLLCNLPVYSQHENHQMPEMLKTKPMALLPNKGFVHRKVSTKNREAQAYFDQGLSLYYAFNDGDAARSFERAAELDPQLAIAHWGVALAKFPRQTGGGNPDDEKRLKEAREAINKAMAMNAPPGERIYIEALSKAFSDDGRRDKAALKLAYKNAMGEIYKRSPKDYDAATLYAMSMMYFHFSRNWTKDGKSLEYTLEMVSVLENGLKRNPKHLGLTHIYIHTVEDSLEPERALKAANFLRSLKLNSPTFGHLVHMPAHIYVRTGDFQASVESNEETAQMPTNELSEDFRKWHYGHVAQFLLYAFAATGKTAEAEAERKPLFDATKEQVELRAKQISGEAFKSFSNLISLNENRLSAAIALARGDRQTAIELLRKAAAIEDMLPYGEPPTSILPVRESLSGALLLDKQYGQAEQVFRQDLKYNPGSGRSLFGLMKSLQAQGKKDEAKKNRAQVSTGVEIRRHKTQS
ncbi:MAG: hypothetical protein LC778_05985 [Acidobacteria bacterium]|nr:hypothetical protein [Acidobacteriota bacterium]